MPRNDWIKTVFPFGGDLRIGDAVRHKGGGPVLTVAEIGPAKGVFVRTVKCERRNDEGRVGSVWFLFDELDKLDTPWRTRPQT
jgi:uncharacterized protein YodC (DUF2158 family)